MNPREKFIIQRIALLEERLDGVMAQVKSLNHEKIFLETEIADLNDELAVISPPESIHSTRKEP